MLKRTLFNEFRFYHPASFGARCSVVSSAAIWISISHCHSWRTMRVHGLSALDLYLTNALTDSYRSLDPIEYF